MLTLEPLQPDQHKQIAEWAHGPQGNVDWEDYAAYLNGPKMTTLGIYLGAEFAGCLFLERIDRNSVECHIATARNKIHPADLAQALLKKAGELFNQGYTAMVARVPRQTRAAARLALRCHMFEWGHTPTERYFILTRKRFERYAK